MKDIVEVMRSESVIYSLKYILQQVLNMGGKFSFNSVQAGLVVSE